VGARDPTCLWLADTIRPWVPGVAADVVFVGVPSDLAVNCRPGARFGPRAIRDGLARLTMYVTDRRQDLSGLVVADAGDVDVVRDLAGNRARIEEAIGAVTPSGAVIVLGGDHSLSLPAIRAVARKRAVGRLGLLVFDAHFDSRAPVRGKEHSGHWFGEVQSELAGRIAGDNIAIIGLSACSYSPAYQAAIDARGILSFTASEVWRHGARRVIDKCLRRACDGTTGIYVSVDIDVLHQSCAPGTSVPNPAGLCPEAVFEGVYLAARSGRLLGLDIAEVNPLVDAGDMTAGVAAHIVMQALAGIAAARAGREAS